jgi:predicted nucleic acid-binding protein
MQLFLDTNVIFAAAITPSGRAQRLFELATVGVCQLSTSPYALDEATRNIAAKYPQAQPRLTTLATQLGLVAETSDERVRWAKTLLPPKDAPILAAAVLARVDLLVTGDKKHFAALYNRTLEGVMVVTPAEALRRVVESA